MNGNLKHGVFPACGVCGRPMSCPACQHLDCPACPSNTVDFDPQGGMVAAVVAVASLGMCGLLAVAYLASLFNGK